MGAARMLVTSSLLNGMVGPCLTLGPLTFVAVFLAIQSDSKLKRKNERSRSGFLETVLFPCVRVPQNSRSVTKSNSLRLADALVFREALHLAEEQFILADRAPHQTPPRKVSHKLRRRGVEPYGFRRAARSHAFAPSRRPFPNSSFAAIRESLRHATCRPPGSDNDTGGACGPRFCDRTF